MPSFLEQLKGNLGVITTFVLIIMYITSLSSKVNALEADVADLSQVVEQVNELNVNVAVLLTGQEYIKEKVISIENKV